MPRTRWRDVRIWMMEVNTFKFEQYCWKFLVSYTLSKFAFYFIDLVFNVSDESDVDQMEEMNVPKTYGSKSRYRFKSDYVLEVGNYKLKSYCFGFLQYLLFKHKCCSTFSGSEKKKLVPRNESLKRQLPETLKSQSEKKWVICHYFKWKPF